MPCDSKSTHQRSAIRLTDNVTWNGQRESLRGRVGRGEEGRWGGVERERDYGRREKIRKRHREDELGGDGGGERT